MKSCPKNKFFCLKNNKLLLLLLEKLCKNYSLLCGLELLAEFLRKNITVSSSVFKQIRNFEK